jgi:hypothetical protein
MCGLSATPSGAKLAVGCGRPNKYKVPTATKMKQALAACRTGVDFYVPAILPPIERLSLLKMIATIADGR